MKSNTAPKSSRPAPLPFAGTCFGAREETRYTYFTGVYLLRGTRRVTCEGFATGDFGTRCERPSTPVFGCDDPTATN